MPHWGNRGMTKKVKLRDVTPEQFKNYDCLTKEEHDYLEAVIKPITKDLKYISLSHGTMPFHYLSFKNKNKLVIGRIDTGIYEYKSIEKDYDYTLEELGL
jgi:hypothetical protein